MDWLLISVIAIVALALLFDFTNGFHDAANSVGTVVATRALPAKFAPAFSAFFNFAALFIVGTAVANTVAKTVDKGVSSVAVIFAALFAAVVWNYITWYVGMPSSSSHAILGGLVGAGVAAGFDKGIGFDAINIESVEKAAVGLIASPVVAIAIAFLAMYIIFLVQKIFKWHDNHTVFKGLQLVAAAGLSFGHGANDAQKTMGVIAALLLTTGYIEADGKTVGVPTWVKLAAYSAIALGTLWGGWKIIETMGLKLTTLHANSGAAANIGSTVAIFGATSFGAPISTTQAAASSVVGAGVASGKGANWKVVGEMVVAWILTIPAAALVGFVLYWLTQLPTVLAWIVVGAIVLVTGAAIVWAMSHSIHADDVEAEIPTEEELDVTEVELHPHLKGTGPVA